MLKKWSKNSIKMKAEERFKEARTTIIGLWAEHRAGNITQDVWITGFNKVVDDLVEKKTLEFHEWWRLLDHETIMEINMKSTSRNWHKVAYQKFIDDGKT